MKKLLFLSLFYLCSCGSANKLKKYYTVEDKTVFDLIEKLQKNSNDKDATDQLPNAYTTVLLKRQQLTEANYTYLSPGDRYVELAKEWGVMQQMYDKIYPLAAIRSQLKNLWNPAEAIQKAKLSAAGEFYNQGLEFLNYDNKQAASKAYDLFVKAEKAVPDYKDVAELKREALEKATIKVVIKPVGYSRYSWNYWGYQNDWLQQQIVNDLNAQSYRDVRFYTDWNAGTSQINPDRIVEINFTEIFVGSVFTDRRNYERSIQVETGKTKSIPPQPVYGTVTAKVYVTRKYMESRATLECRIYDWVSGNNLLYDRFPERNNWQTETATYTGDRRALTDEDWRRINSNGDDYPPSRNEIADKLMRNCYQALLSRIKSGVKFGM